MRNGVLGLIVLCLAWSAGGEDLDRDGVSDALEQELIERFLPRFWLDARECAERPARFYAGESTPRVQARDGTLYAQASPSAAPGIEGPALELHYYHLWDRDCGRLSPHALDAEHVAALVVRVDGGWTAKYWYAAAHESTVCDASNAARADVVLAETRGPDVWVSAGKHASFLARELCGQRGCGVDDCGEARALVPRAIVNLGERGRPLNGADWVASADWPLEDKLGPDFDRKLLDALAESEPAVLARVNGDWRPTQFALSIGGDVLGAAGTAFRHGGGGVAAARHETGGALAETFRAAGSALLHVARALGIDGSGEPE